MFSLSLSVSDTVGIVGSIIMIGAFSFFAYKYKKNKKNDDE